MNRYRVYVGDDDTVLGVDAGDGYNIAKVFDAIELYLYE